MSVIHLAVVIDYDHGAILASDVEMALEDYLATHTLASGERGIKATAVIVSESLYDKLLARAAYVAGVHFGIDAVLGMVATAYGIDAAERLRPEALAFGKMVEANKGGGS